MYYCNQCCPISGAFSWLSTGILTGISHLPRIAHHTGSCPSKPHNGYLDSGDNLAWYQNDFMRSFVQPDFVYIHPSGKISALKVFPREIGTVEVSGNYVCRSNTGMAVLINYPHATHGFVYQHTGVPMQCSQCGRYLNDVAA